MNTDAVKTKDEIEKMREGGKILAEILSFVSKKAVPGVSTAHLNTEAERLIRARGATPSFQTYVEKRGFSVVRDLAGHGVGHAVHEDPMILNFGKKGTGEFIRTDMTLALEPMVNEGDWRVKVGPDGWGIRTADGMLSAHFEHTIVVTKDGCEILTEI
ncbi:M24 family metallopeptidase [Candidatus Azambacteria bacterium]|nr:M24 family metallopeptidase [Candidatus Azambacteria bacterium]